jgi:hypothetical protein
MTERKAGHLTLLAIAVTFALAAAISLLPYGSVYKANLLGWHTVCPFAPASTVIAVVLAALALMARRLWFGAQP